MREVRNAACCDESTTLRRTVSVFCSGLSVSASDIDFMKSSTVLQ
jgi:hypothetical protein